jgi:hypothetical protein
MNQAFREDGWRVKARWVLAFAMPLFSIYYFYVYWVGEGVMAFASLLAGLLFVGTGASSLWELLHRSRPVVEVSDERVEYGSIRRFGSRSSIPLAEVRGVTHLGYAIELETRSGKPVTIDVAELSNRSRQEVCDAIERRIAERRP